MLFKTIKGYNHTTLCHGSLSVVAAIFPESKRWHYGWIAVRIR